MALGRVLGAHGLRGEIRVRLFGDGPENLLRAPEVALVDGAEDADPRWVEVSKASAGRRGEVRLGLAGMKHRDQAESCKGRIVVGRPERLAPLPPGEYYWRDLVGCQVRDAEGREIGSVRELWDTGAHDVLVVEGESGAQYLVPTAEDFLREVDVAARSIVIDAIPGLLASPRSKPAVGRRAVSRRQTEAGSRETGRAARRSRAKAGPRKA